MKLGPSGSVTRLAPDARDTGNLILAVSGSGPAGRNVVRALADLLDGRTSQVR